MLSSLVVLAALATPPAILPAWDAPSWGTGVKSDTRPPDAHEARVFGAAYCEGRPDCQVEFLPIGGKGSKLPVMNHRVPISVAYGSFTRPGAQEVLLTLCPAQTDTCDGVTLLRREGGRWKAIHHTPGVTPRDCLKFRRFDGRDQLACRENEFIMFGSALHLVTADDRRTMQKTLLDGASRECVSGQTGLSRLGDWRKQDVNGDGRPDLLVELYRYTLDYGQSGKCVPYAPTRAEGERIVRRWAM